MKTLHQKFDGTFEKKQYKRPKSNWKKSVVDKTDFVPDIKKMFNLSVGTNMQSYYDTDLDPDMKTDLSSFRNLNDITEITEAKKHFENKNKMETEKAETSMIKEATKQRLIKNLKETGDISE